MKVGDEVIVIYPVRTIGYLVPRGTEGRIIGEIHDGLYLVDFPYIGARVPTPEYSLTLNKHLHNFWDVNSAIFWAEPIIIAHEREHDIAKIEKLRECEHNPDKWLFGIDPHSVVEPKESWIERLFSILSKKL